MKKEYKCFHVSRNGLQSIKTIIYLNTKSYHFLRNNDY